MSVLGVRCSTTDFTFAIVEGTVAIPSLLRLETVAYPKGFSRPELLNWLLQEFEAINENSKPDQWAIKGAEPMAAKGNSFASRVECEAMFILSVGKLGSQNIIRKVKPTIAKDLGLKGRAKALIDDLDHSLIPEIDVKKAKEFDAILVAWSCL